MVGATGSNQTAKARSTSQPLVFNASENILTTQNLVVVGFTTIGLANTSVPVNNSQLSFELISDTLLRIKVRGTDGILRSADITLT